MAAIDYEVEYNNRARVPEHAEIFARWMREAEDYRTEAMKERRAELGLAYGSTSREFIDLFSPSKAAKAPLALFIHGGYWRSLDPSMFSHAARGLNAHGVTVAVAGYNLCPQVSIADIIEEIRHALLFLWQRTGQRVMVYGHSAGGHLAAAMLATDWHGLYPKTPPDLVPAAYSISGVFDLSPLVGVTMNQDLRLDEQSAREASPLFWPAPKGRAFDAVVGGLEIERVPAPEPDHRRRLEQGRRRRPLSRDRRHQPLHRARCVERSEERHGRAAGRAGEGLELFPLGHIHLPSFRGAPPISGLPEIGG